MKKVKANQRGNESKSRPSRLMPTVYPFAAIVGQEEMKLGLILNVIDPAIGGVLLMGHRGTGKSTAVRALADLLPEMWVVCGCAYSCDPAAEHRACANCAAKLSAGEKLPRERRAVPVVDLPLGATEDRVCGAIDIERALKGGEKIFDPGLLARANRGFLYIDEVNLLEDHLVDLLLDVAVTGRNKIERENISIEHPANFVLIGSGNPEEGELRPQLLDRFGLYVEVKTANDPERRLEIVEKRDAFEREAEKFCTTVAADQAELRRRITRGRQTFIDTKIERSLLRQIVQLCSDLNIDGHRGELTTMHAARALAAFEGRKSANEDDVRRVAAMSLRHRMRRNALDETASNARIEQALDKVFSNERRAARSPDGNDGGAIAKLESSPLVQKPSRSQTRSAKAEATNEQNGVGSGMEISSPAGVESNLPAIPLTNQSRKERIKSSPSRRRDSAGARVHNSQRGRYARSVLSRGDGARIAFDATLREFLRIQPPSLSFPASTLRYKQFAHKKGKLFIFVIDASGSMALNRINLAKSSMYALLQQSYINRDSLAIVALKGTAAEVILPPSRSILRARRALETLTIGGGTPLCAGLACAVEVARLARNHEAREVVLLVFTDGGANVPLRLNRHEDRRSRQKQIETEVIAIGSKLKAVGVQTIVLATHNSFNANNETETLAKLLGAEHLQLEAGGISSLGDSST